MKNFILFVLSVGLVLGAEKIRAGSPPYSQSLAIYFDAPSLKAYVSNAGGLRTGVDPNVGMDHVGQQQINGEDHQLNEIPRSGCSQSNLDEGQASTLWEMDFENPSGVYVLNYSSALSQGADIITICIQNYGPNKLVSTKVSLLAQSDTYKHLQLVVSPTGISTTSIITSGDFLRDTQSACNLKAIAPKSACSVLEVLASGVEKAIAKGDSDKERNGLELYLRILNRLHNWGGKGFKKDWDDFKEHSECDALRNDKSGENIFARDPAYSALKLDAETLLKALPGDREHGMKKTKKINTTGATIIKKGAAKLSKG